MFAFSYKSNNHLEKIVIHSIIKEKGESMKVIKRDGRVVEYDKEKIIIAIQKANNDVVATEQIGNKQIDKIVKYIEDLKKKRMLVEDIQDIIEQKLMECKKYELAKKYIIYRYRRALVRKSNTTDESILGLIKNGQKYMLEENKNKNALVASTQRDLIAGEVSRDLTKRILLPEQIVTAHENGVIHFHAMDYFLQPIFNSCLINMADMLDNGTVMNGKMIETPKSFQAACNVMTQIITAIASGQYGGQTVDIQCLGKYLHKSYVKFKGRLMEQYHGKIKDAEIEAITLDRLRQELSSGIQTIQYQINTLMTTNGQTPLLTLFLNLDQAEYKKENAMIIEEILNQRLVGIKDENGVLINPVFPKLVYLLNEDNCLHGNEYDYLTRLAIKCANKRLTPSFLSSKIMQERYGGIVPPIGNHSFLDLYKKKGNIIYKGRFNQGVVSLNLPQIALLTKDDKEKFFPLLEERLDLCYDALMCRYYALLGTASDVSPIHWQHGAISRINKKEKIDDYLKDGYSTLSLGYIGLDETVKIMTGVSLMEDEGLDFGIQIMKYLKNATERFKKETGLSFQVTGTFDETISKRFVDIDYEQFGKIKGITDKGYYTNAYHTNSAEVIKKLEVEKELEKYSLGGLVSFVSLADLRKENKGIDDYIDYIYDNVQHVEFIDDEACPNCGCLNKEKSNQQWICTECNHVF